MKRVKRIRALLGSPTKLGFPDSTTLYHLQSRSAAAIFRNKVRHDIIGLTGLMNEFDVEEFFADNPEMVILHHTPQRDGSIRVLAHCILIDGSGADLSFTLPSVTKLREVRRQLEYLNAA